MIREFIDFQFQKLTEIAGIPVQSLSYFSDLDVWDKKLEEKIILNGVWIKDNSFYKKHFNGIKRVRKNLSDFFTKLPEELIVDLSLKNSESNYFGAGDATSDRSNSFCAIKGKKSNGYIFITSCPCDIAVRSGEFYSREYLKDFLNKTKAHGYETTHGSGSSIWTYPNPSQLEKI